MAGGYTGKVLFVDLDSKKLSEEALDDKVLREFIGGMGLGAKILFQYQKGNEDALGEANLLGFTTGPLTGTPTPSSSRYTVVSKSPLTGTWGDANSGGAWGPELKACGYDAIFFKGISKKPVYLAIYKGNVELRDASHIWGKDTIETGEILQNEVGDSALRVAAIGPAGERKSLIAAIINDSGRAAARSGVGAVMGAKRLKAIALRGTGRVNVKEPEKLRQLRTKIVNDIKETKSPFLLTLKNYGTPGLLGSLVMSGAAPIKNWNLIGAQAMPGYEAIDGPAVLKYVVRKYACSGCPIACGSIVSIDGKEMHRPEYETLASFGTMCLNNNLPSIIRVNDICNRYGFDTISLGTVVAFAMECYEKGLLTIKDTDGLDLTWGNGEVIPALVEKIGRREGIGELLADGVKVAAEKIGGGAREFAMHIQGQEPAMHDPRLWPGRGAGYISDPTPARHTTSFAATLMERGANITPYPDLQPPQIGLHDYSHKDEIYSRAVKYEKVFVSSGLCIFLLFVDTFPLLECLNAVTGWDMSLDELLQCGERIQTVRQLFNLREGIEPSQTSLPERLSQSPSTGPYKGVKVDFEAVRAAYYRAMGWDEKTGIPTAENLKKLGLDT